MILCLPGVLMGHRGHQHSNGDPRNEHQLLATIKGLGDGSYPNVT